MNVVRTKCANAEVLKVIVYCSSYLRVCACVWLYENVWHNQEFFFFHCCAVVWKFEPKAQSHGCLSASISDLYKQDVLKPSHCAKENIVDITNSVVFI